jgi:hypothetical protein
MNNSSLGGVCVAVHLFMNPPLVLLEKDNFCQIFINNICSARGRLTVGPSQRLMTSFWLVLIIALLYDFVKLSFLFLVLFSFRTASSTPLLPPHNATTTSQEEKHKFFVVTFDDIDSWIIDDGVKQKPWQRETENFNLMKERHEKQSVEQTINQLNKKQKPRKVVCGKPREITQRPLRKLSETELEWMFNAPALRNFFNSSTRSVALVQTSITYDKLHRRKNNFDRALWLDCCYRIFPRWLSRKRKK